RYGNDAMVVARHADLKDLLLTLDDRTQGLQLQHREIGSLDDALDPVAMRKGAFVLGMVSDMVGPAQMRAGLQLYLTEHSWANASSEDLLSAIQRAQAAVHPLNFHDPQFSGRIGVVEV